MRFNRPFYHKNWQEVFGFVVCVCVHACVCVYVCPSIHAHTVSLSVPAFWWPCLSECQRLLIGRLMDWADPVACCMWPFVADQPIAQTLPVYGPTSQTPQIVLFPTDIRKKHTFTSIKERIRCSSMCLSRAPYLSMIIWSLIWENLILLFVSLSRIFSYLDVVTLCRCAQVSKVSASLSTPHPN